MRNHALSLMSFVIISHFIFTKQASFYTSFKHQQGLTSCRGLRRPCTPLLWGLASPPLPHESARRFTPHKKMLKGRLRRSTASVVLPQRREGRRGSLRPRQIDHASCEADATPGGCCAPVPSALAMLAFSCRLPASGYAANSSFIMAYGPVDAGSCFCEVDVNC